MSAPVAVGISEQEYLTNPEYEHCEYIDGEVIPLNVGTKSHSRIQVKLARYLDTYFDERPIGYAAAELHCLTNSKKRIFRLPDICVVLNDDQPGTRFLERSPDFVVEIRSPEDTVAYCTRKMEEYLDSGSRLGWLVLPDDQAVVVFKPDRPTRTLMSGEKLDGGELLPGLEIEIAKLF